jgi:hydroxyethylthiazole kinase
MPGGDAIWQDVLRIRRQAPLIHNITNYVVMNTTANALLAIGASPVMAHAREEVEEMARLAGALVINIGTLSEPWIESMHMAMLAAHREGKPIVLDPVGAGATPLRTETARRLMDAVPPAILRGNGSEIMSLVTTRGQTKGVDSRHDAEQALAAARELSGRYGCAVCVSGAVDLVVHGDAIWRIHNGHPLMARVTGMGCTASALIGAVAAVNESPLLAAAHGMVLLGVAGEIAAERAEGPGSLQVHLLDALHRLRERDLEERARLEP